MRKPCQHGKVLDRGLRCDHGYLQLYLFHKGRLVCKNFGPHDKLAEDVAEKELADIRLQIRLNRFGMEPDLPQKTLEQAAWIWFKFWSEERDGDGRTKHGARAIKDMEWRLKRLLTYFGAFKFDELRSIDIEARRDQRLAGKKDAQGNWIEPPVLGTTLNRELSPLSAIYNDLPKLMDLEKIKRFKMPIKNPCEAVTKAELRVHERILTDYEVKKLFNACRELNDFDALDIIEMILTSVLSVGDVKNLEVGQTIDISRSKTGVPVHIPITVLTKLNFKNWRRRWIDIRKKAGLSINKHSPEYVDAKVLRKTGINWPKGKFDIKLISEYAGHSDVKTTEGIYTQVQAEKLQPIAEYMQEKAKQLRGTD